MECLLRKSSGSFTASQREQRTQYCCCFRREVESSSKSNTPSAFILSTVLTCLRYFFFLVFLVVFSFFSCIAFCGSVVGSRVQDSVLDSGAVGPGSKSQPRSCRVTVLGKLFTPIVPLFTKQQNCTALFRVARVTAGLAESNGSLPSGL